jgi:hypothetical protein
MPHSGLVLHVHGQLVHTVHTTEIPQVRSFVQLGQRVLYGQLFAPVGCQEPSDTFVQLIAVAIYTVLLGHS